MSGEVRSVRELMPEEGFYNPPDGRILDPKWKELTQIRASPGSDLLGTTLLVIPSLPGCAILLDHLFQRLSRILNVLPQKPAGCFDVALAA